MGDVSRAYEVKRRVSLLSQERYAQEFYLRAKYTFEVPDRFGTGAEDRSG